MLRITQVKLPCGSNRKAIEQKVRKILRLRHEDVCEIELERRSVDARKKPQLFDVYTVLVSGLKDEKKRADRLRDKNITVISLEKYRFPYSAVTVPASRCMSVRLSLRISTALSMTLRL